MIHPPLLTNVMQTCSPSGPPPHNPTEISVVGDATYMDVRWSAVEMQCPDLRSVVVLTFVLFFTVGSQVRHHGQRQCD